MSTHRDDKDVFVGMRYISSAVVLNISVSMEKQQNLVIQWSRSALMLGVDCAILVSVLCRDHHQCCSLLLMVGTCFTDTSPCLAAQSDNTVLKVNNKRLWQRLQ